MATAELLNMTDKKSSDKAKALVAQGGAGRPGMLANPDAVPRHYGLPGSQPGRGAGPRRFHEGPRR